MFTKAFWVDALERAVRTGAQVLLGAITGTAAVSELDWAVVGITTGVAVLASLLMSLAGSRVGAPTTASLVRGVGK